MQKEQAAAVSLLNKGDEQMVWDHPTEERRMFRVVSRGREEGHWRKEKPSTSLKQEEFIFVGSVTSKMDLDIFASDTVAG